MIGFSQQALFYAAGLPQLQVSLLVAQQAFFTGEALEFSDAGGGREDRALAVPMIAGMDGIEVAEAGLTLQALEWRTAETGFTVTRPGGADTGLAIALPREMRLARITLRDIDFPDAVRSQPARYTGLDGAIESRSSGAPVIPLRLVVRVRQPDGSFGPPAHAAPPFTLDSPLYAPLLAGATFGALGGHRARVTLPSLRAEAVLLQLAHGERVDQMQPLAFEATVEAIEVDAVPEGLRVDLETSTGDVALFEHRTALLPAAGVREVTFQPLAERILADALAAADADSASLALPLRIACGARAKIGLSRMRLEARYRLDALGDTPEPVDLDGTWRDIPLEAASSRRPAATTLTLTARAKGRRLNGACAIPPTQPAALGMALGPRGRVATPVTLDMIAGHPLVALRLRIAAAMAAELSVQLHADAADLPGEPLGAPAVVTVAAGLRGWIDAELPEPLALGPGPTRLWIVARTTFGTVAWRGAAAEPASDTRLVRLEGEAGTGWGVPETALGPNRRLDALVIEAVPDPQPAPDLLCAIEGTQTSLVAPLQWRRLGPREFDCTAASLPEPLVAALSNRPGPAGRVPVQASLVAREMVELRFGALALFYDPTAAPGHATGPGDAA